VAGLLAALKRQARFNTVPRGAVEIWETIYIEPLKDVVIKHCYLRYIIQLGILCSIEEMVTMLLTMGLWVKETKRNKKKQKEKATKRKKQEKHKEKPKKEYLSKII
jgi:hypothetical protein